MQNKIRQKINKADNKTLERMSIIYKFTNNRNINCYWKTQEERIKLKGELDIHKYINQVLLKI